MLDKEAICAEPQYQPEGLGKVGQSIESDNSIDNGLLLRKAMLNVSGDESHDTAGQFTPQTCILSASEETMCPSSHKQPRADSPSALSTKSRSSASVIHSVSTISSPGSDSWHETQTTHEENDHFVCQHGASVSEATSKLAGPSRAVRVGCQVLSFSLLAARGLDKSLSVEVLTSLCRSWQLEIFTSLCLCL